MLKLENLRVSYKSKPALDLKTTIEINDGERVGIIGSNGAGKSTLLKSILKTVEYEGIITYDISPEEIAVHMQQNEYSDIVPVRIIMEAVLGMPVNKHPLAAEMIEFFEFEDCLKKKWKHLSGGQKQRLTLILVLCQESPLTMLDEVTSGLDFETRQKLMEKLTEWYSERSTTLLITSHYYEELDNLASKILFLDKGNLIAYGDKNELFKRYCGRAVITCKASNETEAIAENHRTVLAPSGTIAFSCRNAEEENEILRALTEKNLNYRRSCNDIEIMTINAKAAYYGGTSNEKENI